MVAVLVIAAAEQRGIFRQQGALQRGQPLGQSIDLLRHIGLLQLEDGARRSAPPARARSRSTRTPRLHPGAGVDGEHIGSLGDPPGIVGHGLQIAIAHLDESCAKRSKPSRSSQRLGIICVTSMLTFKATALR
jgi:hypothetical protein